MQFDELRAGDFARLGDAVDDWTRLVTKLDSLRAAARDDLRAKALAADWAGVNATVTRQFITRTAGEFDDAHTQASSIRDILRDTRGELVSCRDRLLAAIERGRADGLDVRGSGGCGFSVRPVEGRDDVPEASVESLRARILALVAEATDRDTSAARALRTLVDQTPHGFSSARYTTRDAAVTALEAADTAARLARDPAHLSAAERAQLTAALKEYARDPLFAEQFATGLGPAGTLAFWSDIDNPSADLQKHLSLTLATATQSDSEAMRRWERDMVARGDDIILRGGGHQLGFQVMSNLMRWGDFDDRFLTEYGTELMKMEKEEGSKRWLMDPTGDGLNRTGSDTGRDPMAGFMKALSHSPGAATDFFSSTYETKDGVGTSNFEYLFENRTWPTDHKADGSDSVTGYNALGHALEAAMTGHPAGAAPDTDLPPHSREQAALYRSLVESIADEPKRLTDHGFLSDSVGRITAEYLPDINRSLSNDASGHTNSLFPVWGAAAEPSHQDVTRFLMTLGQNPEGYAAVEIGQKAYMANLMDYHLDPRISDASRYTDDLKLTVSEIAERSGEVSGMLTIGRQESIYGPADEEDKDYNDAMNSIKTGISGGVGIGVGVGATFISSPVGGAVAAGATETVTSLMLDQVFKDFESNAKDEAGKKGGDHWDAALRQTVAHGDTAAQIAALRHRKEQLDDLRVSAREGSRDGFLGSSPQAHGMAPDMRTEI
ncbi:DUF6571 family protein [Streptomyces sp. NPDC060194]|uniref:DUF6571 family protein n=1 Tax=Streptomyces sp. NPDC060194 TaxID=3347069 RepID=UPI0036640476